MYRETSFMNTSPTSVAQQLYNNSKDNEYHLPPPPLVVGMKTKRGGHHHQQHKVRRCSTAPPASAASSYKVQLHNRPAIVSKRNKPAMMKKRMSDNIIIESYEKDDCCIINQPNTNTFSLLFNLFPTTTINNIKFVFVFISIAMIGLKHLLYTHQTQTMIQQEQILNEQLQSIRINNFNLQSELSNLQNEILTLTNRDIQSQKELLQTFLSYQSHLQHNVQQYSKQKIIQKYGTGPHYVEVQLNFHHHHPSQYNKNENNNNNNNRFVIELYPMDEMPYSTYWFLEQVSNQLYDGFDLSSTSSTTSTRSHSTTTSSSTTTTIIASPNQLLKNTILQRFENKGLLSNLLFNESPMISSEPVQNSEYHSHPKPIIGGGIGDPYTVGYSFQNNNNAAVGNTPSFFIGGEGSTSSGSSSSSLFGKVVVGMNTIDQIRSSSSSNNHHGVSIRYMRILQDDNVMKIQ